MAFQQFNSIQTKVTNFLFVNIFVRIFLLCQWNRLTDIFKAENKEFKRIPRMWKVKKKIYDDFCCHFKDCDHYFVCKMHQMLYFIAFYISKRWTIISMKKWNESGKKKQKWNNMKRNFNIYFFSLGISRTTAIPCH